MNEQHKNTSTDDYTFLREKIKERPVNKFKIVRQSLLTISLAVVFALFACFVFFFFEKGTMEGYSKEQEAEKITLSLQETTNEILPEDMVQNEEVPDEAPIVEDNTTAIADAIAAYNPDIDDYQGIYSKMKALAVESGKSLVTVVGIQDKTTWLNASYENKTNTTGVVLEDNGTDLFILANASVTQNANDVVIVFPTSQEISASVKSIDPYTNLAILTVPLDSLYESTKGSITYASFANSAASCRPGDVVIAIGDPLGYDSSIAYGIISSSNIEVNGTDKNYALIITDIYGSVNANGVLINKNGKIIGIIDQSHNKKEFSNMISALGISELNEMLEDLCNGVPRAHMGLYLTDVNSIAKDKYGVPAGAYIMDMDMDSPAMNSGIHKGDVIVGINNQIINNVTEYEKKLKEYQPGEEITVSIKRQNGDAYIDMDVKVTLAE